GITTFYTIVFAFFVIAPFRSRLRFSPKQTVLIACGYAVLSLVLFLKGFDGTNMVPDFFPVALILWLTLTVGGCFLVIKANPAELLFSVSSPRRQRAFFWNLTLRLWGRGRDICGAV
ncbi:MAG: hypothetical protein RRY53_08090, partial [Pseudoflavonifractor sp.]